MKKIKIVLYYLLLCFVISLSILIPIYLIMQTNLGGMIENWLSINYQPITTFKEFISRLLLGFVFITMFLWVLFFIDNTKKNRKW